MPSIFSRTELLFGQAAMERLSRCRVAVFGIGGVGGYVVEALTRSGVGSLDLVDHDSVDPTNLNRQIIALHSTIGRLKVDVAEERCKDINPDVVIRKHPVFYLPENAAFFDFSVFDYVVDCIDTVSAKIQLVLQAQAAGVPVISSMGTGNKVDPSRFLVSDLYSTSVDPLARVMRHELRKRGVSALKVVYSTEVPIEVPGGRGANGKAIPGSNAFVPSSAGLLIASEVIRDLLNKAK